MTVRRRPGVAGPLAVLLVAGLLVWPAGQQGALAATVRGIATACPDGHVPEPGFSDTIAHAFEREVGCIAAYGVVAGTSPATFGPNRTVTRGQLATYVAGVLGAAGSVRPVVLPDAFADDDSSPHGRNIDWLAHLGIVRGFADGTYRPDGGVTRAQLSSLLVGALGATTGETLRSTTGHFDDDARSPHRSSIDALASAGIVTGTGPRIYDPTGRLQRGQLAAFVARTVDLLAEDGHVVPAFGADVLSVAPTTAHRAATSGDGTSDTGRRTYTVALPLGVDVVTVALFPADNATVSGGRVRFAANTVIPAGTGTSIEVVNGTPVSAAERGRGTTQRSGIRPGGGKITFAIDSVTAREVVPVVYVDVVEPNQGRLDLPPGASASSPLEALEPAVVGGKLTWDPGAPAAGVDVPVGTVRTVDLARRS